MRESFNETCGKGFEGGSSTPRRVHDDDGETILVLPIFISKHQRLSCAQTDSSNKGFAAMSSTTIQLSNILLDILGSDLKLNLCERLREEANSVLKTEDDWHNPALFNRLVVCDSVIRESLRCHPILIKGLTKEVVRADGVSLPDGTHVPQGTWLGVPVLGIHRDDRFYRDSSTYDPYRFSALKQEREKQTGNGAQASSGDLDAATTSASYLGFGYGRHAW